MAAIGIDELENVLREAYGWTAQRVDRVLAGTATDNFLVSRSHGDRVFAKVYRNQDLDQERAAIELSEYARARGGVPIPRVHRSLNGETIGRLGTRAVSVWSFVEDAETAEGGLFGDRWNNVGAIVGRLHAELRHHPAAMPMRRPANDLLGHPDPLERYDGLIDAYQQRQRLTDFEAWALDAARLRRTLLPSVDAIVGSLPPLTTQVVHGDLASPNVLLRGDAIAALIDFHPPTACFVSWEIARIGCDPRTVMTQDDWQTGLASLKRAYRRENPAVTTDDLDAVIAVGCAYTIYSTYPLAEPIHHPHDVTPSLVSYAESRHETALRLLAVVQGES